MIKYKLKQEKNTKSEFVGNYYAYPVIEETMNLEDIARHLANHDAGFSEAVCTGVIKAMVKCIKEQMLEGKNVKIDGLAIFSVGIRNKRGGAASVEEFSVTKNIDTVKFRARATGQLTTQKLDLEATLRRATAIVA